MEQLHRCETCAIPWERRALNSVLTSKEYVRKYRDCILQSVKDTTGAEFVERITAKISCSEWKQTVCCHCGIALEGTAYEYCGRPYCTKCGLGNDYFDEEYS